MTQLEHYMQHCIDLAEKARGFTGSNPLVGAVLVYNNQILAEGYHQKYGEAHAEVNCLNAVAEADKEKIAKATLYVSLEPCSHYGKTPPCTERIIKEGIKQIVVASTDPNPKVAGKGIQLLKNAGVHVIQDVLQNEAKKQNYKFFCYHEKKRPYIILKFALSRNGMICRSDKKQQWLSNDAVSIVTHSWRSNEDAILVGKQTVINDNPKLTTRYGMGKNPIRMILDSNASLDTSYAVFSSDAATRVYTKGIQKTETYATYVTIDTLEDILDDAYEQSIQSIIVEGGNDVLQSFIKANLYDEVRVIHTSSFIEDGIASPSFNGKLEKTVHVGDNTIQFYKN